MSGKSLGLFFFVFALVVACSDNTSQVDENNQGAETAGALDVVITGLPDGIEAQVVLEGPDDGSWELKESATIDDLSPGVYSLLAEPVSVEGIVYGPNHATQEITVRAGETAAGTVRYSVADEKGGLHVEIRGLPDDVSAAVTVAGPEAFFEQIESTRTFEDIAIGNYTVAAEEVESGPAIFAPDPVTRSVTVGSIAQASTRVDYSAVPGTMEIIVTGLPTTLTPQIHVTGPEGYQSGELNAATVLEDLAPGDYQVTAEDIFVGSFRLRAGTQSVVVESRETVTVTVHFGPPWEWIDQFGTSGFDYAYSVAVNGDDDVFVAGYTLGRLGEEPSVGSVDIFVARYNSAGERQWLRQFGTAGADYAHGIAVDATGHLYVVGITDGAFDGFVNQGEFDVFITRLDGDGDVQWVEQFGSEQHDAAAAVAVDSESTAYVVGHIDGMPGESGAAGNNAFIARYGSDGEQLWLTRLDSGFRDQATDVAVDSKGDAFMAGFTYGELGESSAGGVDPFVARFNRDGEPLWISQFGTNTYDTAHGIAFDAEDHLYVAGLTSGQFAGQTHHGGIDAYLARLDGDGALVWVTQFGTDTDDFVRGLAADSQGRPYIIGYTGGALPGNTEQGIDDAFVARFDEEGEMQWARQFGTAHSEEALDIAINSLDQVVIVGQTTGNFPGFQFGGLHDAFVVVYDPDAAE